MGGAPDSSAAAMGGVLVEGWRWLGVGGWGRGVAGRRSPIADVPLGGRTLVEQWNS